MHEGRGCDWKGWCALSWNWAINDVLWILCIPDEISFLRFSHGPPHFVFMKLAEAGVASEWSEATEVIAPYGTQLHFREFRGTRSQNCLRLSRRQSITICSNSFRPLTTTPWISPIPSISVSQALRQLSTSPFIPLMSWAMEPAELPNRIKYL